MLSLLLALPLQSPALQEQLDALAAVEAVPGACLAVAFDDGTTWAFAAGLADPVREEAMTVEHRLMSGSIGKTYFAALYLDLVAEGRLQPEARIADWLGEEPWFARLPNGADITVEMLMHHTSGVPEHVRDMEFWEAARADPAKVWRPEELVAYVLDEEPHFAAGEGWSYADTNFILAGMVMERVLDRSVYREVHRRYLGPLGLDDTLPSTSADLPGLAQGHHILGQPGREAALPVLHRGVMEINPQLEWCGGGYYSTTADLARWGMLLGTGAAAPREAVEASVAGAVEAQLWPGDRYAAGIIVSETDLGPAWGHSGWFPGYLSELMYFPEHGFAVALQVNSDDARRIGPLRLRLLEAAGAVVEARAAEEGAAGSGG